MSLEAPGGGSWVQVEPVETREVAGRDWLSRCLDGPRGPGQHCGRGGLGTHGVAAHLFCLPAPTWQREASLWGNLLLPRTIGSLQPRWQALHNDQLKNLTCWALIGF